MNKKILTLSTLLFLPFVASAQTLQVFIPNLIGFLGAVVVPFLIGMAFLFFVFNGVRYFVIGGSNEQDREKAKSLAIYGIAAFVFLVIFWGIINMLTSSIGLGGGPPVQSDYIP